MGGAVEPAKLTWATPPMEMDSRVKFDRDGASGDRVTPPSPSRI
jgi:hypothetical protein